MMGIEVTHAWLLAALPLIVLPWMATLLRSRSLPGISVVPFDPLSRLLNNVLRIFGTLAILFLILGLSEPYSGGETISRRGLGAQIVLLLDRSGSMNDTFAGRSPEGKEESKAAAMKRLLGDFVGRRPHDLFGVAAFSTSPFLVVPLTDHHEAVRAAIDAADRPGLNFTNVARGLAMALSMFNTDRPDEHHVILLVSDGGAVIETHAQELLRADFQKFQTDLYFLFLRTKGSKGIYDKPGPDDTPQAMPERYLHLFFESLRSHYKTFQAESPEQVESAIEDIDGLARYPITYTEHAPRHDLRPLLFVLSALAMAVLIAAKLMEVPRLSYRRGMSLAKASP